MLAWVPETSHSLTDRVPFRETSFSRTGFCPLPREAADGIYRCTDGLPIIGRRLVIDGVDAVRVTFQSGAQSGDDCYVVLNTITDRAREDLDVFRMSMGEGQSQVRSLVCALPADAILSYQMVNVGSQGLESRGRMDMGEWIRFLDDAYPESSNPLRVVNGRGNLASLFVGPDAAVMWPSQDLYTSEMRAARSWDIGASVSARLGAPRSRSVVVHEGEGEPVRTLVLFDGEMWRANGVGWLTGCYPGLRVVTIDAGDLEEREAELTQVRRVGALLRAVCREAAVGPVMVAGQSYGGLAVLEAALRADVLVDEVVSQSPSLWWGGARRGVGEGTLMKALRMGLVTPGSGVRVRLQVGTFERTMRPVVDQCAHLLRELGVPVELDLYRSGHDVAWWREGLVRALDEWWARP